jgi:hypothetical protein
LQYVIVINMLTENISKWSQNDIGGDIHQLCCFTQLDLFYSLAGEQS